MWPVSQRAARALAFCDAAQQGNQDIDKHFLFVFFHSELVKCFVNMLTIFSGKIVAETDYQREKFYNGQYDTDS
jgi:hypothetical protein